MFCEKNCKYCDKYAECGCEGCEYARQNFGCELAECCREKKHDSCLTCNKSDYCELYKNRDFMPIEHMKKTGSFDERNHLLYKWLPLLLGLMIIKTAVNIALSYLLIKSPDLFVILSGATALIIGGFHTYILYKIKSASKGFALASLLIPISIVLAVAASLFTIFNVNAAVFIIFAAIANVVSVSEEYDAHSAVVLGIEDNNSRKWIQLWKVYSAVILLYLISLLAAYYNELNMFILIICIAVMAIESILEIVFLYSNLVVFKDICKRRK